MPTGIVNSALPAEIEPKPAICLCKLYENLRTSRIIDLISLFPSLTVSSPSIETLATLAGLNSGEFTLSNDDIPSLDHFLQPSHVHLIIW